MIHPQFHPLEPEWLIFAGDPAPRMFRVRRDGSGMECLHQHGNDEFVVHETFLGRTGDIVFTIWPRLLCRMDWTTREIVTQITAFNAWHIASNAAGTQVLCDTNHPDEASSSSMSRPDLSATSAWPTQRTEDHSGANPGMRWLKISHVRARLPSLKER